ncbi:3-phosphoshikimate 1-carboxyvinyltransferase [Alistipes indistinctus]|uniref:3-phosphoshikimate 1-carboxyvinyltransferase n=2 Tax=Alistipes indistinctus TaxID=626932 RepID=UPI0015F1F5EF|nr:3-phosphoshikimate 1-carboxyvinyltransferase [Alistipes indistinctus]BCG54867.1 3-phosphoshikimate 1-carboxyvinyltransferase [Alistipes indistinctus]
MKTTIHKGRIAGSITAPASKSYAQRAVAAALLAGGETTLTHLDLCNDTRAALDVARRLGASVSHEGTTYTIRGGLNPVSTKLNIGESGLATRLFTPIASLCHMPITINGEGSILRRPIEMMEEPLQALGVEVISNGGYLPISVKGPMRGGEIHVDGSLSSQFITGLLMALPLSPNDTVLHVENLKSRPYVDMTIDLAARFGVAIEHNNYEQFYIAGGQHYTPCTYNIEGDWSGASCLLVAGATAGSITIRNLNHISLQADLAIIEALARAGAEIITTNSSVTVHGGPLHAFEFDATDCPDLFPALAALAASCEGTSVLTGTQRLTYKESNRAETIAEVFGRLGIGVDLSEKNTMRITGGPVSSAVVDSHNDHRIAMAAAVAALSSDDSVVIEGANAADKSYPNFWNDLDTLRS